MKQLFINVLFFLFNGSVVWAQKQSIIGFSANLVDFAPSGLKVGKVDPGFSVMYWKGITPKTDFSIRYNGLFSDYAGGNASRNNNGYINEFEGALHARPVNDDKTFSPFLTAGLGTGNYTSKWEVYAPLGAGLQLNMMSEGYLFLQANYRLGITSSRLDNNMFYSLGFTQTIGKKKERITSLVIPVETAPVKISDRDNDGVPDAQDQCPDQAGSKEMGGCPDTDNDGIADNIDKCPTQKGTVKYQGCPVPDTDGDGINDEEDKCPLLRGVAKYEGCPVPDRDGDGVNDEEDKCPELAGLKQNHGCPEVKQEVIQKVNFLARHIQFQPGKSVLLKSSYLQLNRVAALLNEDKKITLNIEGHTDNVGNDEKNLLLSRNRANAVCQYLVNRGIDKSRLSSKGFGSSKPVSDNKTVAGRAKNRRVELLPAYN